MCLYSAVTVSTITDVVPSVTVVESLVQVTVVAGPPVEIQVNICKLLSNTTLDIVIVPVILILCRYEKLY